MCRWDSEVLKVICHERKSIECHRFFIFNLQNSEAMVSIDMPAGPSEVLVIADKLASHVHVAADLLSQVDDVS